jgi:hypothetical protein
VSSVPIPLVLVPQLQALANARNGRSPDATLLNLMLSDTNYLMRWRTKELFSWWTPLRSIPATSGTRTRWRFAAHLGPKTRQIYVHMVLGEFVGTAGSDPFGRFTLLDSGGSTIGTADAHHGEVAISSGSAASTSLPVMASFTIPLNDGTGPSGVVTVTPDSDVFGVFEDKQGAKLISATVLEVSLDHTTENGYLQSPFGVTAPIYSSMRSGLVTALRTMWKRGAAHLLNWTVDQDSAALTRISATGVNIIDGTSGVPSSSTPGYTLDLLQKGSVRRGNVPCVFKAYGKNSAAGGAGANVDIVDSTNTILASVNFTSTTASWVSTTVNLPASVAKYDLRFRGDGTNTVTLYAVSLYQHEA